MNQKKQLSILEFSRLTGISRDNLRFYDRIGLLCPEQRGENNYRYYARSQLNSAYLISSLRLLEVGLEDIRRYSAGRTPERMLAFFAQQEERIQAEIARLRETSEIMKLRASLAQEALAHAEGAYLLEERPRERIFLCPPAPDGLSGEESEIFAYEYAAGKGVHLGHPAGVLITPATPPVESPSGATASILKPAAGGATHGSRLGGTPSPMDEAFQTISSGLGQDSTPFWRAGACAPPAAPTESCCWTSSPSRIRGTISDGWRSRWRLIPVWKEESNFFCEDPP